MDIHPIRNDRDHAKAMRQIEKLWGAAAGTPEADALEVLVTLVDAYEAKRHAIEPPDPIDAIKFRMEQQALTRADLQPMIGSRARVSEVLNRQRPLTIAMIRKLRDGLGIPGDVLLGRTVRPKASSKKTAARSARVAASGESRQEAPAGLAGSALGRAPARARGRRVTL
jgi:HTH-type transcriptional regulator / antitoxin HigA